jgi:hypothetical protein
LCKGQNKKAVVNRSANNRLNLSARSSAALREKGYWRARLAGALSKLALSAILLEYGKGGRS